MSCYLVFCLFLSSFFLSSSSLVGCQTISSILVGPVGTTWSIDRTLSHPLCLSSSCCCFTGQVSVTLVNGELYLGGNVTGACDANYKQDNLDPPSAYTFTQEFFGIDDYTFTLSSTTESGTTGLALLAVSSIRSTCSFSLFSARSPPNNVLPNPPSPNPTIAPLTADQSLFVGQWTFDNTCAATNASCCCLVGTGGKIRADPSGATQSYFISGTPSVGCQAPIGTLEQDDFPWPLPGQSISAGSVVSTSVQGFLANQDNYNIMLTVSSSASSPSSIFFQDTSNPVCSIRATQVIAGSGSGNTGAANTNMPVINISMLAQLVITIGITMALCI